MPRDRRHRPAKGGGIRRGQHRDRRAPAFVNIVAGLFQCRGIQRQRIAAANLAQRCKQRLAAHAGFTTLTTTMAAMNTHSRTRTDVART